MKLLIIDNGSKYIAQLKILTRSYSQTIKKYSEINKEDSYSFDLIILSGGHTYSVIGHEHEFAKELELIKHTTTPILGICMGFELIAYGYGATLQQMAAKEKSIININKIIEDPIFRNLSDIKVFESHRWVVTDPGNNLISLARSKDGIEIIKHREKTIYGFQFHPEMFAETTHGHELFANFINLVENKHI